MIFRKFISFGDAILPSLTVIKCRATSVAKKNCVFFHYCLQPTVLCLVLKNIISLSNWSHFSPKFKLLVSNQCKLQGDSSGVFGWTWQHNVPLIRGLAHQAQRSSSQYGKPGCRYSPTCQCAPALVTMLHCNNVTLQQCFNVFQPIFQCADWRYSQTCRGFDHSSNQLSQNGTTHSSSSSP